MKIVVAMDSFKGSLSSLEAGVGVKEAARKVWADGEAIVFPVADGGEGTVDALLSGMGGKQIALSVVGPDGDTVQAQYGILPDGTAVMEMAAAAGLTLTKRKDPMTATTYGVGQMICDAIDRGCRNFLVGIGGSATNDGGAGMLMALGYTLKDRSGNSIPYGAAGLDNLYAIGSENVHPMLNACTFRIACDVTNPLCGETGCSAIFAPQKGAKPEQIPVMDAALCRYATLAGGNADYPGTGAAGGLGFAFLTFTNAVLESGVKLVLQTIGIEAEIQAADLVITGEGKLDGQTVMGKAPIGVAELAKKYGKKVIAFCGMATPEAVSCLNKGIDAYYPITPENMPLAEAMRPEIARKNLINTATKVFKTI